MQTAQEFVTRVKTSEPDTASANIPVFRIWILSRETDHIREATL